MPRLLTSPIKRKKNRYELSLEEKCKIYWRRFKTFSSLQEGYYKWCLFSGTLSRQSRLTLNGYSVERMCRDLINFNDLITLSNNNLIIYENSCVSNLKGKYVHYLKAIVPSHSYPTVAQMLDWFLGNHHTSKDETKVQHNILDNESLKSEEKLFVGIYKQAKFVFIHANYFKQKKWGEFLKALCFCTKMYFEILNASDIKATKIALIKYNNLLKSKESFKTKYLNYFKSLIYDHLLKKDERLFEFVFQLF